MDQIIYKSYGDECMCAIRMVLALLENISQEMDKSDEGSPFYDIKQRVKDYDSAMKKLDKKGDARTLENVRKLHDVAGIRVIVPVLADVERVKDAIMHQMNVVGVKDYNATPKKTGYRSLHLQLEVDVPFMKEPKKIPVEIQICTIAQSGLNELEHNFRYKNDDPPEDADEVLNMMADQIHILDMTANRWYKEQRKKKNEEGSSDVFEHSLAIEIEEADSEN